MRCGRCRCRVSAGRLRAGRRSQVPKVAATVRRDGAAGAAGAVTGARRSRSKSPSNVTGKLASISTSSPGMTTVRPARPSASSAAAVCVGASAMRTGFPPPTASRVSSAAVRRNCSPISRGEPKSRDSPLTSSMTSGPTTSKRGVKSSAILTSVAIGADNEYRQANMTVLRDDALHARSSGGCDRARASVRRGEDNRACTERPASRRLRSWIAGPASLMTCPVLPAAAGIDPRRDGDATGAASEREPAQQQTRRVGAFDDALQAQPGRERHAAEAGQRHVRAIEDHRRADAGLQHEIERFQRSIDRALEQRARALDRARPRQPRRIDGRRRFRDRLTTHPQQPRELDAARRRARRIEPIEGVDERDRFATRGRRAQPGPRQARAARRHGPISSDTCPRGNPPCSRASSAASPNGGDRVGPTPAGMLVVSVRSSLRSRSRASSRDARAKCLRCLGCRCGAEVLKARGVPGALPWAILFV